MGCSPGIAAESAGVVPSVPKPYALFLGDATDPGIAKTAFGLRDWAFDSCIGEIALPASTVTLGLPRLTPDEARARGAKSLVIGVANNGGFIDECWIDTLLAALACGLDVVSGMHRPLQSIPAIAEAARRHGRRLVDIRTPPANIPPGNGRRRSGKRLLTVGTDCALGKKYAALAVARGFARRGIDARFRATGQTGILIAGEGIPMDAVVSDFEAGAAEMLTPDAAPDHWDVIEGQGSLLHPAYSPVSLGLLHGSQPDVFVVCHLPGRRTMLGFPDFPVPSIEEIIELTVKLGRRTNPAIRCGGIALNTAHLSAEESASLTQATADRFGLPVADPIRGGASFEQLLSFCLQAEAA